MVTSRKSIPHHTRTDVNLKGRCSLARRFYVNCACLAVWPTPRDHDDYSLRELRIRHNATFLSAGVKDTIGALLPILSPALADLKILEVLISKVAYDGAWTLLYFPKSLQALLDRCTSLEELEAAVNDTPADEVKLPASLRRVHIFEVLEDEDSWASDDM